MKRGEVWDADIGGKAGKRPVVILTRSRIIPHLSKVVIAEITSQSKGYPTQIDIGLEANLSKNSYVSGDALHTIPKDRLVRLRGELSPLTLSKISEAISFALDLN